MKFQAALKAKFIEQRALFGKETKALEKEAMELQASKRLVLLQIQEVVTTGGSRHSEESKMTDKPTSEDLAAWDAFMLSPEAPSFSAEDDVIRRALHAARHPEAFMQGIPMQETQMANAVKQSDARLGCRQLACHAGTRDAQTAWSPRTSSHALDYNDGTGSHPEYSAARKDFATARKLGSAVCRESAASHCGSIHCVAFRCCTRQWDGCKYHSKCYSGKGGHGKTSSSQRCQSLHIRTTGDRCDGIGRQAPCECRCQTGREFAADEPSCGQAPRSHPYAASPYLQSGERRRRRGPGGPTTAVGLGVSLREEEFALHDARMLTVSFWSPCIPGHKPCGDMVLGSTSRMLTVRYCALRQVPAEGIVSCDVLYRSVQCTVLNRPFCARQGFAEVSTSINRGFEDRSGLGWGALLYIFDDHLPIWDVAPPHVRRCATPNLCHCMQYWVPLLAILDLPVGNTVVGLRPWCCRLVQVPAICDKPASLHMQRYLHMPVRSSASTAATKPLTCETCRACQFPKGALLRIEGLLEKPAAKPADAWDEWLHKAGLRIAVFCRSALLFYLLACLHLLSRSIPLRKSQPKRNAAVKYCRSCLRGAPWWCAIVVAACFLPQSAAVRAASSGEGEHVSGDAPDLHRYGLGRAGCFPTPVSVQLPEPMPGEPPLRDPDDFKICAEVHRFQRSSVFSLQFWDEGLNTSLFCAMVRDDAFLAEPQVTVFPIRPQPNGDKAILGSVSTRLLQAMHVPICIQVRGARTTRFLELAVGTVSYYDVQDWVGSLWPAGGRIFVGSSEVPLEVGDSFVPHVGVLVQVLPSHARPARLSELADVLCRPANLGHFETEDLQAFEDEVCSLGFLGPGRAAQCVCVEEDATPRDIRAHIGEAMGLPALAFTSHRPAARIPDLQLQGCMVNSLVGILPNALLHACIVFIDARDLGKAVTVLVLPPQPFTLTAVLGLLGIERPPRMAFDIQGADRLVGHPEGFMPQNAAVISFREGCDFETVRVASNAVLAPEEESMSEVAGREMSFGFPTSHSWASEDEPCHLTHDHAALPSQFVALSDPVCSRLHRTNNAFEAGQHSPPCPLPTPVQELPGLGHPSPEIDDILPSNATGQRGEHEPCRTWNPGTLHEALTPCPQEDTSANTGSTYPLRDVDGTSPLRFPANSCDDAEHDTSVPLHARLECDRSYDESPAPVADSRSVNSENHVEDGDDVPLPDDDSPVLGSASPSLDTPRDQSAWRLPVRVLRFQTTQYYSSLWVKPGEDIDEIMIRAEAIYKPPGDLFALVAPDGQPSRYCLSLICYPAWWVAEGTCPFIVLEEDRPDDPYVEIFHESDTLDDVLPTLGLHGQMDAYIASGDPLREAGDVPTTADLLCVQRWGTAAPVLRTVAAILADSDLDTQDADLPLPPRVDPATYLLLGVGFEQLVMDLQPGPAIPQLSRATGIPAESLDFWVQIGRFEHAAVQGRPVHRAIGFRDKNLRRQSPHPVVFIDGRTLGRPLCCRQLPADAVSLEVLLNLIDVQLPDHLQADWVGGHPSRHDFSKRTFAHRCTVILWAHSPSPAASPTSGRADTDDGRDTKPGSNCGEKHQLSTGITGAGTSQQGPGEGHRSRSPRPVGGRSRDATDDTAVGHASVRCLEKPPMPAADHRPLPTPCRAKQRGPVIDCAKLGSACTLLEQADRSGLDAMLDRLGRTRTFGWLDSIFEKECHRDKGQVVCVSEEQQTDHASHAQNTGLRLGELDMGFTVDDLRAFLCTPVELASFDEAVRVCPPNKQRWLVEHSMDVVLPAHSAVICYTDGSYEEHQGRSKIGWSCAFFCADGARGNAGAVCIGAVSGSTPAWMFPESQEMSAYVAECVALAHGAWVAARRFPGIATIFMSDCMAALGAAEGIMQFDKATVAGTMHGLHLLRRSSSAGPVQYCYVPGHRGVFGNELTDGLAKAALHGCHVGSMCSEGLEGWLEAGGPFLSWFALTCRSLQASQSCPSVQGLPLHTHPADPADAADILRPFLPAQDVCPQIQAPSDTSPADLAAWPTFSLKIATYNALPLAAPASSQRDTEGLAYKAARPALLARCFEQEEVDLASVQETRCQQGVVHTGGYLRVCSGADAGQLGTEIWLRKGKAILHDGRKSYRLQTDQVVVHHSNPRRLVISIRCGQTPLFVIALHAPHRGAEAHIIEQWWKETLQLCRSIVGGHDCIIAGDCNASVGSVTSEFISDSFAEQEDLARALLHDLVQDRGVWIPATFHQVHTGQAWTYEQKRNGRQIRPDMIAIPYDCGWGLVSSQVCTGIHAGQVAPDHYAAVVSVQVRVRPQRGRVDKPCGGRRRYDEAAMSTPEGQACLRDIIAALPEVAWGESADRHAQALVEHLQHELGKHFPLHKSRRGKRHTFLTDETWKLHGEVSRLRRTCAQCRYHTARHAVAAAFLAWKDHMSFEVLCFIPWLGQMRKVHAQLCQRLEVKARSLRDACAADRVLFLQDCAKLAEKGQDRAAYEAVRKLLGHRRKKPFAPAVLPHLLLENGDPCTTPQQVEERWRRHFSNLEAGKDASLSEVVEAGAAPAAQQWPLPDSLLELPDERSLTIAIASAPLHKTPGTDGIPAIVGRAHPALLATKLHPLLLKLSLCGDEASGMKGGALIHLYKGRGSHSDCKSHRGIMLMPTFTKYIHRALRPCIGQHFQQHALPLQLGGKPQTPLAFAAHIVRGYLRWRAQLGKTACVIFADVASAFYAAIRQLAAPVPSHNFQALCAGLGLTEGDMRELAGKLAGKLQEPSGLASNGASPWLQALTAQVHSGTWMTIGTSPDPVVTRRGTRPGSPWADVTFGTILKRVLAFRDESRDTCRVPTVPWDRSKNLFVTGAAVVDVPVEEVIWADDVSTCLEVDSAEVHCNRSGNGSRIAVRRFSCARHAPVLWPTQDSGHGGSPRTGIQGCA